MIFGGSATSVINPIIRRRSGVNITNLLARDVASWRSVVSRWGCEMIRGQMSRMCVVCRSIRPDRFKRCSKEDESEGCKALKTFELLEQMDREAVKK
jgi:hypothetical protein